MHILNNENKGTREATLWKTFRKGEENIRHKFSRARAKGGEFLEVGDKEVHGTGGWLLVVFWDHGCLSLTGIEEGHMETGGKHLDHE